MRRKFQRFRESRERSGGYTLTIKWGSRGDHIKTYRFRTKYDLSAFLQGVKEAVGWHDFEILPNAQAG